jgi:hypothetical protein
MIWQEKEVTEWLDACAALPLVSCIGGLKSEGMKQRLCKQEEESSIVVSGKQKISVTDRMDCRPLLPGDMLPRCLLMFQWNMNQEIVPIVDNAFVISFNCYSRTMNNNWAIRSTPSCLRFFQGVTSCVKISSEDESNVKSQSQMYKIAAKTPFFLYQLGYQYIFLHSLCHA